MTPNRVRDTQLVPPTKLQLVELVDGVIKSILDGRREETRLDARNVWTYQCFCHGNLSSITGIGHFKIVDEIYRGKSTWNILSDSNIVDRTPIALNTQEFVLADGTFLVSTIAVLVLVHIFASYISPISFIVVLKFSTYLFTLVSGHFDSRESIQMCKG